VNATGSREPRTALEDENRRLKRMFADLSMQADLLREALGKMYGLPRYCKNFVSDAPACVNVSGL
jgi:putative transposase